MRKPLVIIASCAVVLVGTALTPGPRRLIADLRWGTFTPVARTFLEAASRHDSVGLTALATNPGAVARALVLGRMNGDVAAISAQSLQPVGGSHSGDTIVVQFHTSAPVCSPYGGPDEIQFHFLLRYGGPRVASIGGVC